MCLDLCVCLFSGKYTKYKVGKKLGKSLKKVGKSLKKLGKSWEKKLGKSWEKKLGKSWKKVGKKVEKNGKVKKS